MNNRQPAHNSIYSLSRVLPFENRVAAEKKSSDRLNKCTQFLHTGGWSWAGTRTRRRSETVPPLSSVWMTITEPSTVAFLPSAISVHADACCAASASAQLYTMPRIAPILPYLLLLPCVRLPMSPFPDPCYKRKNRGVRVYVNVRRVVGRKMFEELVGLSWAYTRVLFASDAGVTYAAGFLAHQNCFIKKI